MPEAENAVYLPFSATIIGLEESRQKMNPLDPVKATARLGKLNKDINDAACQPTQNCAAKRAYGLQMRRIVIAPPMAICLRGSLIPSVSRFTTATTRS